MSTGEESPSSNNTWTKRWSVGSKAFVTDDVLARWPAQVHGYSSSPLDGVYLRYFRKCRGYVLVTKEHNLEAFTDKNRQKILKADIHKKNIRSFNDACRECKNAHENVVRPFEKFIKNAVSNIN